MNARELPLTSLLIIEVGAIAAPRKLAHLSSFPQLSLFYSPVWVCIRFPSFSTRRSPCAATGVIMHPSHVPCVTVFLFLFRFSNLAASAVVDSVATQTFRLSNLELSWLIIGSCFFVSTMVTTLCCIFFWWQKKRQRKQVKKEKVAKAVLSSQSVTPVIRREDVISFVLPVHQSTYSNGASFSNVVSSTGMYRSVMSGPSKSAVSEVRHGLDPNALAATNRSSSCPSFNVNELNLHLYSPGQETNEDVPTNRPKIGVSLQYDPSKQQLILKVLGALNLPCRATQIPPNPYVKVSILPEKEIKCSTRPLRSNCNPLYNQTFELNLMELNLKEAQLCLKVRDRSYEKRTGLRSDATLGQAIISLADLNRVECRRQVRWCFLEEPTLNPDGGVLSKGEMLVSLSYEPEHSRMLLELLQLRDVPQGGHERDKLAVKVLLYERGVQIAVRRTKSFRRDEIATCPLRGKFVFSLHPKVLHEASCQIIFFTKPKIGTKRVLGRIYLGHRHFFSASANSKAVTAGIDHWHDMIHRSDIAIERWHPFL